MDGQGSDTLRLVVTRTRKLPHAHVVAKAVTNTLRCAACRFTTSNLGGVCALFGALRREASCGMRGREGRTLGRGKQHHKPAPEGVHTLLHLPQRCCACNVAIHACTMRSISDVIGQCSHHTHRLNHVPSTRIHSAIGPAL